MRARPVIVAALAIVTALAARLTNAIAIAIAIAPANAIVPVSVRIPTVQRATLATAPAVIARTTIPVAIAAEITAQT